MLLLYLFLLPTEVLSALWYLWQYQVGRYLVLFLLYILTCISPQVLFRNLQQCSRSFSQSLLCYNVARILTLIIINGETSKLVVSEYHELIVSQVLQKCTQITTLTKGATDYLTRFSKQLGNFVQFQNLQSRTAPPQNTFFNLLFIISCSLFLKIISRFLQSTSDGHRYENFTHWTSVRFTHCTITSH